jgi:hypothetical protein
MLVQENPSLGIMATSKTPGPLQHDAHSVNTRGTPGCDAGCLRGHTPGPIRVAEAPAGPKKPAKPDPPAPAKVDKIIWHVYADLIHATPGNKEFSQQDLAAWFIVSDDTRDPEGPGRWDAAGIKVEFKTHSKTGVKDFEGSLQTQGAIVVYIGHSTMTPPRRPKDPDGPSLGLSPWNPSKGPEIPNSKLRTLLSKSSASLVIIGACDAITAVGKINAGPPVVAINSGPDRVTDVSRLARGAGILLFVLFGWDFDAHGTPNTKRKGGYGTINEGVEASAEAFDTLPDRYELVHGDGTISLFP